MIKKRDRRSAAKHRAILKAAAAVVSEAGYNGAKIEHIAVRAGVGKQTIYRRWPSKAHLLTEVYTSLVPYHVGHQRFLIFDPTIWEKYYECRF